MIHDRHKQQLGDAAEKLALVLTQGRMQKTPARMATALLFSKQETRTSAELCEELRITAGAESRTGPTGAARAAGAGPGAR